MTDYRPDKFAQAFDTFDGPALWDFLHEPTVLAALRTAVVLRRPGVEAISPLLRTTFPHHLHRLKFRQMVGHMIRQVMEADGYSLDRANVRITQKGQLYRYGSVYQAA